MERFVLSVPEVAVSSEILITRGWPNPLVPAGRDRSMSAVLTQQRASMVAGDVAELLSGAPVMELPDREEGKSLETAARVYQWLAEIKLARKDTLVGVGGGALTDLTGFIAATWLRGIESVLVPTTLLAAVDAAIGGKTGINLGGKNLIGAFHLPTRVVINLDVLETIPKGLLLEGTAEALKAGLIGDPKLVNLYERYGLSASLADVIPRSVLVKVGVVGRDYREQNRRAVLNLGHTIGHAVEVAAGMPHGLAIAVGMVAAGAVSSARFGFDSKWLSDLIRSLGLPVSIEGVGVEEVLGLIGHDKKRVTEGVRMVLLRAVGDPVVDVVSEDELQLGLEAVGIDND